MSDLMYLLFQYPLSNQKCANHFQRDSFYFHEWHIFYTQDVDFKPLVVY